MLRNQVEEIAASAGAKAVAVAFRDYESDTAWSLRGGRWFHAASTMKLAVLFALFHASAKEGLDLDAPLHVRNRFFSRLDGEPFRVERNRDADATVQAEVGRTMRLRQLAERMIVGSSNLATNLLLDLLGPGAVRGVLAELGIQGIELVRGVEDTRAHEAGIDNRVTADGLLAMLELLQAGAPQGGNGQEGPLAGEPAKQMLGILERQELVGGIRLGLPRALRGRARVAHKTGEISTVAHDAGLVFLPDRKPYGLVLLSEWDAGGENRQATLGRISRAVYRHLVDGGGGGDAGTEAAGEGK